MNFICEGIDRLGKDMLISNLRHKLGYFEVKHRSKPEKLDFYSKIVEERGLTHLFWYQWDCFKQDMAFVKVADTMPDQQFIMNRSWIGETVYGPIYRGYDSSYIFDLEKISGINTIEHTKLILLTEDFSISKHFKDDGLSLDVSKREEEQKLFIEAFNRSIFPIKKMICVTAEDGSFRDQYDILKEAIA